MTLRSRETSAAATNDPPATSRYVAAQATPSRATVVANAGAYSSAPITVWLRTKSVRNVAEIPGSVGGADRAAATERGITGDAMTGAFATAGARVDRNAPRALSASSILGLVAPAPTVWAGSRAANSVSTASQALANANSRTLEPGRCTIVERFMAAWVAVLL